MAATAREQGAAAIALATHGRSGLVRLVMGSVATATLQHALVPVLFVHPPALREGDEAGREPGAYDDEAPFPATGALESGGTTNR